MSETQKFRVLLPIEIDGAQYPYGQVVELDLATAKLYSHALVHVASEEAAVALMDQAKEESN